MRGQWPPFSCPPRVKAYATRNIELVCRRGFPAWIHQRHEPPFQDLLRRANVPA